MIPNRNGNITNKQKQPDAQPTKASKTKQVKTISTYISNKTSALGFLLLALLLAVGQSTSFATAGAVETAMTDGITAAKTVGESVLAVAATVIAAFLLFKLAKRAANKA